MHMTVVVKSNTHYLDHGKSIHKNAKKYFLISIQKYISNKKANYQS